MSRRSRPNKISRTIMRATQWESAFMQEARDRILKPVLLEFIEQNPNASFRDILSFLCRRFRCRFLPLNIRRYIAQLGVKRVAGYRIEWSNRTDHTTPVEFVPGGQAEFEIPPDLPDPGLDPDGGDVPDTPDTPDFPEDSGPPQARRSEGKPISEGASTPARSESLNLAQIQSILSSPPPAPGTPAPEPKPFVIRGHI